MAVNDGENIIPMPGQPSADSKRAFDAYAKRAQRGEVIGAAVILLKAGGGYELDIIGAAEEEAEFVLGLTRLLERKLEDRIIPG
jgi:hypothetical protein